MANEVEELKRQLEELRAAHGNQRLDPYLQSCHELHAGINVITDSSLTTQGIVTDPTSRLYPERIIQMPDFATQQAKIWASLLKSPDFRNKTQFTSKANIGYLANSMKPISSELDLRDFVNQYVDRFVQELVGVALADEVICEALGLRGTVEIKNHQNDGETARSIGAGSDQAKRREASKTKRKAGTADNFYYFTDSNNGRTLVMAVEYKAPHKLSVDDIVAGLKSEIRPEEHVINQDSDEEDLTYAPRRLAAAVVTQLFSYMVGLGLRYGYICTGEALVFLRIPADHCRFVYYSVCVPQDEVAPDIESGLYWTAVAQVFAFLLQAIQNRESVSQEWLLTATRMKTWDVEYDDILRKIPSSAEKEKESRKSYKPSNWKASMRQTPIQTRSRSRCRPSDDPSQNADDEDEDSDRENYHFLSPTLAASSTKEANRKRAAEKEAEKSKNHPKEAGAGAGDSSTNQMSKGQTAAQIMEQQPYCTQECLLGLARGGPLDQTCPNIQHHKSKHLPRQEFLHLFQQQLAADRRGTNALRLSFAGAVGGLVKVRLSSHGYTLVAKGFQNDQVRKSKHEEMVYSQAADLQGKDLPVCLGTINLESPYYIPSGEYKRFLFLSWAGMSLKEYIASSQGKEKSKQRILDDVCESFERLHEAGVLHCDAALRNLLYDVDRDKVIIIDLERARFVTKKKNDGVQGYALASLPPNKGLKRKCMETTTTTAFNEELQGVMDKVNKAIATESKPSSQRLLTPSIACVG